MLSCDKNEDHKTEHSQHSEHNHHDDACEPPASLHLFVFDLHCLLLDLIGDPRDFKRVGDRFLVEQLDVLAQLFHVVAHDLLNLICLLLR